MNTNYFQSYQTFKISDISLLEMPISKRAKQLKKAREIRAQKLLEAKKNDKRRKVDEIVDKMDEFMLDNTLKLLTKSNIDEEQNAHHRSHDN